MADTNQGHKFYICVTPKPTTLAEAAFEALTWVQVGGVGQLPDSGVQQNLLNYDVIETTVTEKQKGVTDAGGGMLECAYRATDVGQVALRVAAATKYNYAFKHEFADAPDSDTSNTIVYNRGVLTGPRYPGGGAEDFVREQYTLGYNQLPVIALPEDLTP